MSVRNYRSDYHQGNEGGDGVSGRNAVFQSMYLHLTTCIDLEFERAFGHSCSEGPQSITGVVAEPELSVDVRLDDRSDVDTDILRY